MSILKFQKWAYEQKKFLVSIPTTIPMSISMELQFDSIYVQPFFPAYASLTGGAGHIVIHYISAIDQISENSFLIHCGYENLPEVHRELIVTSV